MTYSKELTSLKIAIKQRQLVSAEHVLLKLLQKILLTFPNKPQSATDEYKTVQLLYSKFDQKVTNSPPLYDEIHSPEQNQEWIDRKQKNYYLLACCRNPRLMDKILLEIRNYLLPEEDWYFSQKELLKALKEYEEIGYSEFLHGSPPKKITSVLETT
jgi:hypothetical protein